MATVHWVVSANFGEMSEDTRLLVAAMANRCMRVAGPSRGRRGRMQDEEAECSIAVSALTALPGSDGNPLPSQLASQPFGYFRSWRDGCGSTAVASA